jgi:5-methylcytosine-specific restriction endonuclease McrA
MPRAPKPCGRTGCTERVRGRTYCEQHTPEPWNGGHGSTRKGRGLRAVVLEEEPFCRDCWVAPSVEAGHIIPVCRGGAYVRSNLKGQCRACNVAQIQRDRIPQGRF